MLTSGGRTRRPLARCLAVTAVVTLALAGAGPGFAAKGGAGGGCPPTTTDCTVWDSKPGDPGGGGNTGGGPGGGGGGPGRRCIQNGVGVPCYDPVLGWFNNADGCYYRLSEPQPPGGPAGRQAYTASCSGGIAGGQITVWLPNPPGGYQAPPDPADLAAEALAKLTLQAPPVGVAPRSATGPGLVGLPVWLWTKKPEPTGRTRDSWATAAHPMVASTTDRTVTVTIRASVTNAVWKLGTDGPEVTCATPGVPHVNQSGPSPECGYAGYRKAGTYQVTVTTHWTVEWDASTGEHGVITTTRASNPATIRINELQVVTK